MLLALALGSAKYGHDLRREREAAVVARDEAEAARQDAEEAVEFLVDLFTLSDPDEGLGSALTARELLDQGSERARALEGRPALQVRLLNALGSAYHALGHYEEGARLLEVSLAAQEKDLFVKSPVLAAALRRLAGVYGSEGRHDDEEAVLLRALELEEDAWGQGDPRTWYSLYRLGAFYRLRRGRIPEAENLLQRAFALAPQALGQDDPGVGEVAMQLGWLYIRKGERKNAEALLGQALEIFERQLGADHLRTTSALQSLASSFWFAGDYEAAESHLERVLAIREGTMGFEHPSVARVIHDLANLRSMQGRFEEEEALRERAVTILEKALGTDHPEVAERLVARAQSLPRERDVEAEALLSRALVIQESVLSPEHSRLSQTLNALARVASARGESVAAERLLRRAVRILEGAYGETHVEHAQGLYRLARFYRDEGRFAEASILLEEAIEVGEAQLRQDPEDLRIRGPVSEFLLTLGTVYEPSRSSNHCSSSPDTTPTSTLTPRPCYTSSAGVTPSRPWNDSSPTAGATRNS